MKNTLLLLFLLSQLGLAQAQTRENPLSYKCGHDIYLNQLEKDHPGFKNNVQKVFASARIEGTKYHKRNEPYKIKVIIHVVWRAEEENLPDSLIIDQIESLTEDFRLQNPDRDNIRTMYADRQGDAGIEFEIAEIIRVQTNRNFTPLLITLPDQVKRNSQGGSDAVDPEHFMNIWICKIQPVPLIGAQVFGYAYPPADLPNWPAGANAPSPELDGIVIDYRCISKKTPFSFNIPGFGSLKLNGRTLTHEVGHYLGLRHIWGDGGGLFGGDSCNADDGVEDTPNSGASSETNCNEEQNTCIEGADADELDMIENYMDYSSEFCMNTFTNGQIAIMRGVIEGPRSGLLEEINVATINRDFKKYLSIYPSPTSNQLFIKGKAGKSTIHIMDVNGRVILTNYNDFKERESQIIDVSYLKSGIYFIHYFYEGIRETGRFIKL
jgi:hypothetical protein